jgi:hypothetical protein
MLVDGCRVNGTPLKGLAAQIDGVVEPSSHVLDQVGTEYDMAGFVLDTLPDPTPHLGLGSLE